MPVRDEWSDASKRQACTIPDRGFRTPSAGDWILEPGILVTNRHANTPPHSNIGPKWTSEGCMHTEGA